MNDDVYVDFTEAEIQAVEKLAGESARDDADMRRALHIIMYKLAQYEGINLPTLEVSES